MLFIFKVRLLVATYIVIAETEHLQNVKQNKAEISRLARTHHITHKLDGGG